MVKKPKDLAYKPLMDELFHTLASYKAKLYEEHFAGRLARLDPIVREISQRRLS